MKIYLLRLDYRRHTFYSEGPDTQEGEGFETDASREQGGLRGWMARKLQTWQSAIGEAKGGFGGFVWRLGSWLQRFIGPDEPLLRGLRKAHAVHLHHPAGMPAERAREEWFRYLGGRKRHHLVWLLVNLLLSPVSLLLAPLPGPNFLGYWFVYRAACHTLALIGVQRARGKEVETSLVPNGALDLPLTRADARARAELASTCGLSDLEVYLVRIGAGREAEAASPPGPGAQEGPVADRVG